MMMMMGAQIPPGMDYDLGTPRADRINGFDGGAQITNGTGCGLREDEFQPLAAHNLIESKLGSELQADEQLGGGLVSPSLLLHNVRSDCDGFFEPHINLTTSSSRDTLAAIGYPFSSGATLYGLLPSNDIQCSSEPTPHEHPHQEAPEKPNDWNLVSLSMDTAQGWESFSF